MERFCLKHTCRFVCHRLSITWNCNASNPLPGFPYEKVVQRTLYLQVLDYDRFSRNDPIGEVSIPLNKLDLANMQTFWKELKPCSDGSVSKRRRSKGPRGSWMGDDGRWEMGENVMGDVIPGCRDAPGGDVAAFWW